MMFEFVENPAMQSVEDFSDRYDITLHCHRLAGGRRPDGLMSESDMDHWECYLENLGGDKLKLYFSKGRGHHGRAPDVVEVLGSMQSDSQGFENTDGFEDWCSEYGFDPYDDEDECRAIYSAVSRQALGLSEFLGEEAYRELLWETEPE